MLPTGAGASYTIGPPNRVGSTLMQIQSPTTAYDNKDEKLFEIVCVSM